MGEAVGEQGYGSVLRAVLLGHGAAAGDVLLHGRVHDNLLGNGVARQLPRGLVLVPHLRVGVAVVARHATVVFLELAMVAIKRVRGQGGATNAGLSLAPVAASRRRRRHVVRPRRRYRAGDLAGEGKGMEGNHFCFNGILKAFRRNLAADYGHLVLSSHRLYILN